MSAPVELRRTAGMWSLYLPDAASAEMNGCMSSGVSAAIGTATEGGAPPGPRERTFSAITSTVSTTTYLLDGWRGGGGGGGGGGAASEQSGEQQWSVCSAGGPAAGALSQRQGMARVERQRSSVCGVRVGRFCLEFLFWRFAHGEMQFFMSWPQWGLGAPVS